MGDTPLITSAPYFNGCTQKTLDGLQDTNTCCSFVYFENHNRPKTNLGRKRKCLKNEKKRKRNRPETGKSAVSGPKTKTKFGRSLHALQDGIETSRNLYRPTSPTRQSCTSLKTENQ